ncbi:predicted protein [Pyrenophora tritici-repentis Pt-1C-BFP]|uniref:Uncharacterized protein n=1 Tax=Pyrenophora tritici-repentis (strain Pt-1C-BFP) TaxID=426418 RepID=B2WPR8_PYRTR|nr:uncharacterized protein PTRG_11935 [Pyrenophora tritici-repentis Pt-1C-BFP]EDU46134.1 predicted protein [Pyrenophora tritici-repentis Pt-1C-BFP]
MKSITEADYHTRLATCERESSRATAYLDTLAPNLIDRPPTIRTSSLVAKAGIRPPKTGLVGINSPSFGAPLASSGSPISINIELQVLESTQRRQRARRHQRGAGKRGGRRDPSLLERLDSNNRAAAPPSTLPARMTESSVPAENVFVFQSKQPASTTPTTATTALYPAQQWPPSVASFTCLAPAASPWVRYKLFPPPLAIAEVYNFDGDGERGEGEASTAPVASYLSDSDYIHNRDDVLIEPSTAVAEFSQLSPASPRSVNRLPDLRAIQWVVYWRLYTGSSAGVAINSANGTELSGSTSAIAAAVAGNKLSAASC